MKNYCTWSWKHHVGEIWGHNDIWGGHTRDVNLLGGGGGGIFPCPSLISRLAMKPSYLLKTFPWKWTQFCHHKYTSLTSSLIFLILGVRWQWSGRSQQSSTKAKDFFFREQLRAAHKSAQTGWYNLLCIY